MPQNQRVPPSEQPWANQYVAIYKCAPKQKSVTQIVIADSAKISKNAGLQRVLEILQRGMISKREVADAIRPTIRYATFEKPRAGKTNKAQGLLKNLLKANNDAAVRQSAANLARRYVHIPNVQQGVLIFLLSKLALKGKQGGTSLFIFKCDFEDISQLTPKEIFRRVKDAFEEQAKKGAQYPYFNGKTFDETIRVFDARGETQYWLNFLDLAVPPTQAAKVEIKLKSELKKTRPEIPEKYKEKLEALPRTRTLAVDERIIESDDLLGFQEAQQIIDALPFDSKISLSLDRANVTVPYKEYGRKWMLADQNGTHYILIKGAQLEVHGDMLSFLDISKLANLRQAKAALDIP